jgi:mannan endo-1,4-beta-mannosidase
VPRPSATRLAVRSASSPNRAKFNESAFQSSDYALAVAAKRNMRLIIPLVGDCATCSFGGLGQYLAWNGKAKPAGLSCRSSHHRRLRPPYRRCSQSCEHDHGVCYRDDPTIMAWENCNMCGIITLFTGGGQTALVQVAAWSEAIGAHIKRLDPHHLYLDTTGIFRAYLKSLTTPAATSSRSSFIHTGTVFWVGAQRPLPLKHSPMMRRPSLVTARYSS